MNVLSVKSIVNAVLTVNEPVVHQLPVLLLLKIVIQDVFVLKDLFARHMEDLVFPKKSVHHLNVRYNYTKSIFFILFVISVPCGPNQEYSECGANSCQMFCEWYYNPTSFACRPVCTSGCICQEPYIRSNNGSCILPEECPESSRKYFMIKYYYCSIYIFLN